MSTQIIHKQKVSNQNEILLRKLNRISVEKNIDNFSLTMLSDNYEFGAIYAIKNIVSLFVKIEAKMKGIYFDLSNNLELNYQ